MTIYGNLYPDPKNVARDCDFCHVPSAEDGSCPGAEHAANVARAFDDLLDTFETDIEEIIEGPFFWSTASALWQVEHGETGTPRTESAKAFLAEGGAS